METPPPLHDEKEWPYFENFLQLLGQPGRAGRCPRRTGGGARRRRSGGGAQLLTEPAFAIGAAAAAVAVAADAAADAVSACPASESLRLHHISAPTPTAAEAGNKNRMGGWDFMINAGCGWQHGEPSRRRQSYC